jgi:hypothetical protein
MAPIAVLALLALMPFAPQLSGGDQVLRPESTLRLVRGQLSLGPYALGMTVAEAQSESGRALELKPNVDDTGQCEGLEAPVSFAGQPFILTFTAHSDGLRLRAVHARLAEGRDLDEVAAEVVRRVPNLRLAELDPAIKGNKSAWSLPSDPLQVVLISVKERWFSISRGGVNGW